MIKILILLVAINFLITGCTRMDVYTFKKERADQNLKGNQGYIVGEKPETPEVKRDTKRTLFGLDVELADLGSKNRGSESARQETEKETKEAPAPRKKEPRAEKTAAQKVKTMKVQPKKVETEEDWIK